ncbi:eCIS core domain-containing protein [Mycobacterium sp.]|uniref:eCIS core domain-containing protein n=1 Tax=Mycobacterium sp. TaxID=1785 RepID=UPI002CC343BB|nr:DUF4157 domain-containing protein [Mycobacterium sp.]HTY31292.1 DUF4157 domain-containing protein [Mycobacterium sp.]
MPDTRFDFTSLSVNGAPLRRKLAVGAASDPAEAEADRAAEQVMRMPDPSASVSADGNDLLRRKCEACEDEDKLQRTAAGPTDAMEAPSIVHDVVSSPGQVLDGATRAFMESRFGHDFSRVRVHTSEHAARSARAVNARAYTVGQNIVFASGQFDQSSSAGRRLLAHELAHTLQGGGQSHGLAPVRRQPYPGDGMRPPGDCDWTRYIVLQGSVVTAKAVVDGLGKCRAGDDCNRLAFKIAAISAEIAARLALMIECFRGGDTGHREQVKNKTEMLEDCFAFFNGSNCSPELVAAMAVVVAQIRALLALAMVEVAVAVVVALIVALIAAIIALLDLIVAAIAAAAEGAAMATAAAVIIALLVRLRGVLGGGGPSEG